MAHDDFRRFYNAADFPLLQGPLAASFEVLKAQIDALTLQNQIGSVELVNQGLSVLVFWDEYPGDQDLTDIQEVVDAFVGGAPSEEPIEVNAWDPVLAPTTDPVIAIDVTSPGLAEGTYQVIANCMHRMQADVAAQGSKAQIIIDRSDGASYQQADHTALSFTQSFNLPLTFTVDAGQTIRVRLAISKITGAGGTAEMTGARVTIDKIS